MEREMRKGEEKVQLYLPSVYELWQEWTRLLGHTAYRGKACKKDKSKLPTEPCSLFLSIYIHTYTSINHYGKNGQDMLDIQYVGESM